MPDANLQAIGQWPPARLYPARDVDAFVAEASRTIEDLRLALHRMTARALAAERRLDGYGQVGATDEDVTGPWSHDPRGSMPALVGGVAGGWGPGAPLGPRAPGPDHPAGNGFAPRSADRGGGPPTPTDPRPGPGRLTAVPDVAGSADRSSRGFWRRGRAPAEFSFAHLRDGPLGDDAEFIAALLPADDFDDARSIGWNVPR